MKKHAKKVKEARKMLSPLEVKLGVSKWDSKAWQDRKEARQKKVISDYMKALGKKGGETLKAKMPADYYKKLSELGHKAKQDKAKDTLESNK